MTKENETMIPKLTAAPAIRRVVVVTVAASLLAFMSLAGSAAAATPGPGYTIQSFALPTSFSAGGSGVYQVTVTNAGSEPTDGTTITLTDTLPAGVTAQSVGFGWSGAGGINIGFLCSTAPLQCTFPIALAPGAVLEMTINVTVDPSASGSLTNDATVSGGGAAAASTSAQNPVSSTPPAFGVSNFSSYIAGLDGAPDTQAGDHPSGLTTEIDLNNEPRITPEGTFGRISVEDVKDIVIDLPLGFMGSALSAPQCTFAQLSSPPGGSGCAPDTQVGSIYTEPSSVDAIGVAPAGTPIYNMAPQRGVVAEFGYVDVLHGAHVLYARIVPGPSGYVLQITSPDVPQVSLTDIVSTFFGNPAATDGTGNTPVATFTNPTNCSGQPLVTTMYVDSWQHPGRYKADGTPDLSDPAWKTATSSSAPVTGCDKLQFQPSISVQSDTTVADSPSGVNVDIRVPQSEDPNTLATPPLKDASVTLPPGFTVDPSSADGLGACSPAQIDLSSAASPTCPDDSKIGTVQLTTPLLAGSLTGSIYLASEFDNPFNSLLAGYIVVDDPTTGLVIKIPGQLTPDPNTGQITAVFDNNPQFPFSELQLDFKGGPRGVLATPESCGTFTTSANFSPWSFPDNGPPATPFDSFAIDSGCVSGFAPSFTAGTQNAQAGAYSPFVLSLSRSDQDQNLQGLSVTLPPGMLAKLAGVQECSEAALASISSQPGTGANELANPSCPAGSQVGTVQTGAGTGPDPFFLSGKAYLTGPYKGAPYGLSVVVPAVAGPLDLGTVVVRQALYVDPRTAQVTDVSDPFPTILDGIPLRIRRIDVDLSRPGFTINPTSCDPMSVTGTAGSTGGLTAPVSSRFQVGGCSSLGFSPKLKIALTGKGKTRSGDHPTLTATLTQPSEQANIQSAKVALPLSLALDPNNSQHVCSYDVAQAVHGGPVGCPASTIVGTAAAVTPLLDQPLTGNVYLVQGIRFNSQGQRIRTLPSLLVPLRGQIALDLRASSSVNGAQQLVTTFSTIPDAPVSKFTLQINGGPKGLLVITGRGRSICTSKQAANADLGAQSGKASSQNDTLATPCAKPARLAVLSHRVEGHTLLLRVRTSTRGGVTVTGGGLKRFSRVLSAGTRQIRVGITNGASAAKVMSVNVRLQPADARGATHTFRTRA